MSTIPNSRTPKFFFIGVFVIVMLYCIKLYSDNTRSNLNHRPLYVNQTLDIVPGYTIFRPKCKVPYLDPWDPLIMKHVTEDTSIVCNNPQFGHQLLDSTRTHLSVRRIKGTKQGKGIRCCYREFHRRNPNNVNVDFEEPFMNGTCVDFENRTMKSEEFIKVECLVSKNIKFTDTYAFVPLKPKVEERCKSHERDSSRDRKKNKVSVLIVGVDSLSRLHMYRQMQRTRKILKDMKAIELKVHNTQDMYTQPNLVPLLTGLSLSKFKNKCVGDDFNLSDDCPFIWKTYERAAYRTAFGEDESMMNLFNIQGLNGFHKQPTDYYLRPFMMVAEKLIGNKNLLCLGNRTTWSALLNYVDKFVNTMRKRKYFGFFWCSSLCHKKLFARFGDKDYEDFLRMYKESEFSNTTVLIFMSDHGKREHSILDTYQGRIELRNPFVYFVFPDWMKREYKSAFKIFERNAEQLTSHYDIHETLKDLVDLAQLSDKNIKIRSQVVKKEFTYGRSLFLPISNSRTCSDIGVADYWCMCQQTSTVEVSEDDKFYYSQVIINHLNNLLLPHRQCAKLQLGDVITVVTEIPRLSYNKEVKNEGGVKDYHIVMSVLPSDITLNSTLRYYLTNTRYMYALPRKLEVKNYTGQNRGCVKDVDLEPYCYCK